MVKPSLKITDRTQEILKKLQAFKKDAVLVGIPAEDTDRTKTADDETGITNAALLFINNFGSPDQNIPPRPVMAIGIKLAQDDIANEMARAAKSAFSEGLSAMYLYYERAGMIASNSIKSVINRQIGIAPPSDATLASRKSAGFKGKKSLIVTGQMRNAITYVVNKGGL